MGAPGTGTPHDGDATDAVHEAVVSILAASRAAPLIDVLAAHRPSRAVAESLRDLVSVDWSASTPLRLPPFWSSTPARIAEARDRIAGFVRLYDQVAGLWAREPDRARVYMLFVSLCQSPARLFFERLLLLPAEYTRGALALAAHLTAEDDSGKQALAATTEWLNAHATHFLPNPWFALAQAVHREERSLADAVAEAEALGATAAWGGLGEYHARLVHILNEGQTRAVPMLALVLELCAAHRGASPAVLEPRARLVLQNSAYIEPALAHVALEPCRALAAHVRRSAGGAAEAARLDGIIGQLLLKAGDHVGGMATLQRSLRTARRLGDRLALTNRTAQIARSLLQDGRRREARRYTQRALRLARTEPWKHVNRLTLHAQALLGTGQRERASPTLVRALAAAREQGDADAMASVAVEIAQLAWWAGAPQEGLRVLEDVLAEARDRLGGSARARLFTMLGALANEARLTDRAREAFEEALGVYMAAGRRDDVARTVTNLAIVRRFEGDLPGVLDLAERILMDPATPADVRAMAAITAATAYVGLGRTADALEVLEAPVAVGDSFEQRFALLQRAQIFRRLSRHDDVIREAEAFLRCAGPAESRFAAEAHRLVAESLAEGGASAAADRAYRRGYETARRHGALTFANYCLRWAETIAEGGDVGRADALLREALAHASALPDGLRAQLLAFRARLELTAGRPASARALLEQAIGLARDEDRPDMLLALGRALLAVGEDWRPSLAQAVEAFEHGGLTLLGATTERVHDRRTAFVAEVLALAGAGGALHVGLDVALMEKSAAYRARRTLAAEIETTRDATRTAEYLRLEERASALRAARERRHRVGAAASLLEGGAIESRLHGVAREAASVRDGFAARGRPLRLPPVLAGGEPLALLARLSSEHPRTAFVELYMGPRRGCVAVARGGHVDVAALPVGQRDLTFDLLVRVTSPSAEAVQIASEGLLVRLKAFAHEPTVQAFDRLDEEIERAAEYVTGLLAGHVAPALAAGCDHVVLMPHGPLALLPLHALVHVGGAALIDHADVSYAPNVFALQDVLARPAAPAGGRVALAGNADLPSARVEAGVFARLVGGRVLPPATPPADLLRESRHASWLHVATHGAVDHLLPLDTGITYDGGRLTVDDVLTGMRLPAGAVVSLTACEASAASGNPEDEHFGLTPTLLAAGAGTVLAPLWPVDDVASLVLMMNFLALLPAHPTLGAAWNAAQRALRDLTSEEFVDAYVPRLRRLLRLEDDARLGEYVRHARGGRPFGRRAYWAPYQCTGGWGTAGLAGAAGGAGPS